MLPMINWKKKYTNLNLYLIIFKHQIPLNAVAFKYEWLLSLTGSKKNIELNWKIIAGWTAS